MKKLDDNVARIEDKIARLDLSYSVWLVGYPSRLNPKRIGFSKRLREITGHECSKDIKGLVKMWNRGFYSEITDKWFFEIEVNGRARIDHGLSRDEAEKLHSQIAGIGGKAIVQKDKEFIGGELAIDDFDHKKE